MTDAATILGLLADDRRRKVLAALVLGAETPAAVVDVAGVDVRTAVTALHRLRNAGVAEEVDGRWALVPDALADAARDAAARRPEPDAGVEAATESDEKVLKTFFRDGRLTQVPASHAKRRVVLDVLASQFDPGRVYPERDVNFMLQKFHADYAALRRYLVDEEFLERRDGFYWRAGGTYEVD